MRVLSPGTATGNSGYRHAGSMDVGWFRTCSARAEAASASSTSPRAESPSLRTLHSVPHIGTAMSARAASAGARGAAAGRGGRQLLALRARCDGGQDLHVPGAPARVGAEVAGHVGTREVAAFLVPLGLGPHDDAGDAEAGLQAPAGGKGVGI